MTTASTCLYMDAVTKLACSRLVSQQAEGSRLCNMVLPPNLQLGLQHNGSGAAIVLLG